MWPYFANFQIFILELCSFARLAVQNNHYLSVLTKFIHSLIHSTSTPLPFKGTNSLRELSSDWLHLIKRLFNHGVGGASVLQMTI